MDINWRGSGWSPIYFDPEPDEMLALTKSFDTLRIGFHIEKGVTYLVIASGLGNTHSSLSRALGEMNPKLKPSKLNRLKYQGLNGGCAILFEEEKRLWFNLDDGQVGNDKVSWRKAITVLPCSSQLKEICRLAIEQQNLIDL